MGSFIDEILIIESLILKLSLSLGGVPDLLRVWKTKLGTTAFCITSLQLLNHSIINRISHTNIIDSSF